MSAQDSTAARADGVRMRRESYAEVLDNVLEAMGETPLIRLHQVTRDVKPDVLAKVEFFNPGGSVKDRIGIAIIEDAERSGKLKPGGTIVESTSGNTGVGLAVAAAIKGYKTVFVMPDKMSDEKIQLLRAFGARVVVTPTAVEPDDPRSYYNVAKRIVEETPNAILANQYHNPVNPEVHYRTTGPEIWRQTNGRVDVFVAGMGTGGTISGVGRYLKEQNPNVQIVGVDPVGSLLYELFHTGKISKTFTYNVEGIGEDFLPSTLDLSVVDDVVQVDDRESFLMTRRLVREEGLFVGGSSGSAVAGALKYIQKAGLGPDKTVVVLLPDSGSRYLSKIFNDEWMREHGYLADPWCEATAKDVLAAKTQQELIALEPGARLADVIALMKEHGISQAPVIENGDLLGMVREVDLLNHMLMAAHNHSPEESIDSMISTDITIVAADEPLEGLMNLFSSGVEVVFVTPTGGGEGPVAGILTKIDVLDYIATHCI